jgi:hypothetical protein
LGALCDIYTDDILPKVAPIVKDLLQQENVNMIEAGIMLCGMLKENNVSVTEFIPQVIAFSYHHTTNVSYF